MLQDPNPTYSGAGGRKLHPFQNFGHDDPITIEKYRPLLDTRSQSITACGRGAMPDGSTYCPQIASGRIYVWRYDVPPLRELCLNGQ
jgi:hypothetical protein